MATSRYANTPVIALGQRFGTPTAVERIRAAINAGTLAYEEIPLRGVERLDTIAGEQYNDGRYWWLIAAASGIGWGMQAPPGTVIRVPNLVDALALIG